MAGRDELAQRRERWVARYETLWGCKWAGRKSASHAEVWYDDLIDTMPACDFEKFFAEMERIYDGRFGPGLALCKQGRRNLAIRGGEKFVYSMRRRCALCDGSGMLSVPARPPRAGEDGYQFAGKGLSWHAFPCRCDAGKETAHALRVDVNAADQAHATARAAFAACGLGDGEEVAITRREYLAGTRVRSPRTFLREFMYAENGTGVVVISDGEHPDRGPDDPVVRRMRADATIDEYEMREREAIMAEATVAAEHAIARVAAEQEENHGEEPDEDEDEATAYPF